MSGPSVGKGVVQIVIFLLVAGALIGVCGYRVWGGP